MLLSYLFLLGGGGGGGGVNVVLALAKTHMVLSVLEAFLYS